MAKFNGTVDNIENNVNKKSTFDYENPSATAYMSEQGVKSAIVGVENKMNGYVKANGTTPMTGNLSMGGNNISYVNKISMVADPEGDNDVGRRSYNDARYMKASDNPVTTLDDDANLWELSAGRYQTVADIDLYVTSSDSQAIPAGVAFSVSTAYGYKSAYTIVGANDGTNDIYSVIVLFSRSSSSGGVHSFILPAGSTSPETVMTESALQPILQQMVDYFQPKETGKGLSTNDYTDADKATVGKINRAWHEVDTNSGTDAVASTIPIDFSGHASSYDNIVVAINIPTPAQNLSYCEAVVTLKGGGTFSVSTRTAIQASHTKAGLCYFEFAVDNGLIKWQTGCQANVGKTYQNIASFVSTNQSGGDVGVAGMNLGYSDASNYEIAGITLRPSGSGSTFPAGTNYRVWGKEAI